MAECVSNTSLLFSDFTGGQQQSPVPVEGLYDQRWLVGEPSAPPPQFLEPPPRQRRGSNMADFQQLPQETFERIERRIGQYRSDNNARENHEITIQSALVDTEVRRTAQLKQRVTEPKTKKNSKKDKKADSLGMGQLKPLARPLEGSTDGNPTKKPRLNGPTHSGPNIGPSMGPGPSNIVQNIGPSGPNNSISSMGPGPSNSNPGPSINNRDSYLQPNAIKQEMTPPPTSTSTPPMPPNIPTTTTSSSSNNIPDIKQEDYNLGDDDLDFSEFQMNDEYLKDLSCVDLENLIQNWDHERSDGNATGALNLEDFDFAQNEVASDSNIFGGNATPPVSENYQSSTIEPPNSSSSQILSQTSNTATTTTNSSFQNINKLKNNMPQISQETQAATQLKNMAQVHQKQQVNGYNNTFSHAGSHNSMPSHNINNSMANSSQMPGHNPNMLTAGHNSNMANASQIPGNNSSMVNNSNMPNQSPNPNMANPSQITGNNSNLANPGQMQTHPTMSNSGQMPVNNMTNPGQMVNPNNGMIGPNPMAGQMNSMPHNGAHPMYAMNGNNGMPMNHYQPGYAEMKKRQQMMMQQQQHMNNSMMQQQQQQQHSNTSINSNVSNPMSSASSGIGSQNGPNSNSSSVSSPQPALNANISSPASSTSSATQQKAVPTTGPNKTTPQTAQLQARNAAASTANSTTTSAVSSVTSTMSPSPLTPEQSAVSPQMQMMQQQQQHHHPNMMNTNMAGGAYNARMSASVYPSATGVPYAAMRGVRPGYHRAPTPQVCVIPLTFIYLIIFLS